MKGKIYSNWDEEHIGVNYHRLSLNGIIVYIIQIYLYIHIGVRLLDTTKALHHKMQVLNWTCTVLTLKNTLNIQPHTACNLIIHL